MSGMSANDTEKKDVNNVLESSKHSNIHLKFSGYNYAIGRERRWDFPYKDALWIYKEAYQAFGPRMVWGSDFPVVKFSSTYKQAFETLNIYCDFINEQDKKKIFGETLHSLINR
tara:strand:- start:386 stop:727 length:342 start_codon:yes stop_codon:yes gene_type:complete